jgi:hypothetical protein
MAALKEPERITLAEGLTLLERHVRTAEEAKSRSLPSRMMKGSLHDLFKTAR